MSKITGKEYPLHNIFSSEFEFFIPDYQRPYAWTEEESGILFDDLYRFYQEEHTDNYFLGSTVLIKSDNIPRAEVIDGQQRLTTLTILFAVLASRLTGAARAACDTYLLEGGNVLAGIPAQPRLHLRDRDQTFFNRYIQNVDLQGLIELNPTTLDTEAQQHIRSNCIVLLNKFDAAFDSESSEILSFSKFLLNRCFLVAVYTPNQESAFRVFSVMNSRGLDLLPIDIIKSEIIGKLSPSDQRVYSDRWESLENDCGRDGFNEVFTHTRTIFVKERPKKSLLDEFREHIVKRVSPKALIDNILMPFTDAYVRLKNQEYAAVSHADEVNQSLYWLNKIDNYDWMPPAIKFLSERSNEPEYICWFIKKLERLAAYLHVTAKDVNQRVDRYRWLLAEMDSNLDHGISSPITSIELTEMEKREFRQALDGEVYRFPSRRRNYVVQRLDSFVSSGGARYDAKIFSIEHVLPQTVSPGSEWETTWPDTDARKFWLNRIANLVPLARKINSSAQNDPFNDKKTKYFQVRNTSPFALTAQVINYAEWTQEVCQARQSQLMACFCTEWELFENPNAEIHHPRGFIFHLASRGANATGCAAEGTAFIVNRGSSISPDVLSSLRAGYASLRNQLIADGIIVNNTFTIDYRFESSSAAATVILGRSANGTKEWTTLDGRTYAEIIGH